MSNGRVDHLLDRATIDEVLELLTRIRDKLPFLLQLTDDERRRLGNPPPDIKQVVDGIGEIMGDAGMAMHREHPLTADVSVFQGLLPVADEMAALLRSIEDTRLQAGSEAWSQSLVCYGMLRQLQRSQSELGDKLDQLQPLISTRRGHEPAPEGSEDS